MNTLINAISTAAAVAALVVAIIVARSQTTIQRRLAAIEEARRAEELETRGRARVTVNITRSERGEVRLGGSRTVIKPPETSIALHNEGPALARGLQLDPEQGPQRPEILGLEVLPVDLQPGQTMTFQVAMALGDARTIRVTVRWTDEAGDHEEPFTLKVV